MPFYEYQCKSCGHELEAMQKVSDPQLRKCPHCGKSQLQRLMSAPVFRLKGGGWYETDFKGEQDNKRNLADRPEAEVSKDDSAGDAKADSKAADGKTVDAKPSEAKATDSVSGAGTKGGEKPEKSAAKAPARAVAPKAKRAAAKRVSRPARKSPAKAKAKRRR